MALVGIRTKSIPPPVAMSICKQFGVPKKFAAACGFDVAVTGDKAFAKELAQFSLASMKDLIKLAGDLKKTVKDIKKTGKKLKDAKKGLENLF